jgi:tetratricopeptide (TPR) repeat protein
MENFQSLSYQFAEQEEWSEERAELATKFQRLYQRGEFNTALAVALELRELTTNSPYVSAFERLSAQLFIGQSLIGIVDYISARDYFTAVLQEQEEAGVICPTPYASALMGLAQVYIAGRFYSEALKLLSNSISIIGQIQKSLSSQQMMEELANCYTLKGGIELEQGDHVAARDTLIRAIDSFRRAEVRSCGLVTALYYLSLLESEIGNGGFAYKRVRQAVRVAEDLELTGSSSLFAQVSVLRGTLALDRGDFDIARQSFKDAIYTLKSIQGAQHVSVAQPLCNLGHLDVAEQRFDDARKSYKEALELLLPQYGESGREVADVLRYLGRLAFDAFGEFDEAREYFMRACRIYYTEIGEDHVFYRESLWSLGLSHLHCGAVEEALAVMGAAMPLYQQVVKRDPELYLDRLCWYMSTNRQMERFEQVKKMLNQVEEVLVHCRPGAELVDIYCRLGSLFAAEGMKSSARDCFEKAQKMRLSLLGAEAPEITTYEELFKRWKKEHAYLSASGENGSGTDIVELSHLQIPGMNVSTKADSSLEPELVAHLISTAESYAGMNRLDTALLILDELVRPGQESAIVTDAVRNLQQELHSRAASPSV